MGKHVTEKLSAFLNRELAKDERQTIAEHLLQCEKCRAAHDEIKFGVALASRLQSADAPEELWNEIAQTLLEKQTPRVSKPEKSFFYSRSLLAAAATVLIIFGLTTTLYFGFFRSESTQIAQDETETSAPAQKPEIQDKKWNVETIAGTPKSGNQIVSGDGAKLAVGEFLETDADARARVQVANIGQVELAPNSRLQLVKTQSTEHRLALERGQIHARILAPPRLFVVDTPSAVAVDLGCEYTLEVDAAGDSRLHVTSGFVALERDGRESIVPAGAMALTKKGKGLGTPFAADASAEYRRALYEFDFANGGAKSLVTILKKSDVKTSVTLWHLLSRVSRGERERIFDKLVSVVALPEGVTKEGILRLDKEMLTIWRVVIEGKWFESFYGDSLT